MSRRIMNKAVFVDELAKQADLPRATALRITNTMLDIITKSLNEKERVQFMGFGSIEVRLTPKRVARNPRTKEPVVIPERYKAVLKPSPALLNKLNEEQG